MRRRTKWGKKQKRRAIVSGSERTFTFCVLLNTLPTLATLVRALTDSFTALRIEPTTSEVKVTCSNHCATCSYWLDNWV